MHSLDYRLCVVLGATSLTVAAIALPARAEESPSIRFDVTVGKDVPLAEKSGRLLVALSPRSGVEPRYFIGHTAMTASPVLGRDAEGLAAGRTYVLDRTSAFYPLSDLDHIKAGEYGAQAVLMVNRDLWLPGAPGNLYSEVVRARLDPAAGAVVRLELTREFGPDSPPANSQYVKYVKFQSELLTKFHGRPMYLRAGVILPRDYGRDKSQRYPLRISIGGFGTRYTVVERMMSIMSRFRRAWLADDAPRMVLLQLDGAGPFGDPYQVNSANNGPYGDALTQELIPYVEKKYHCIGQPHARVLEGGSTGGWVSLALQVFYPDFFNGCWSGFPDGVDFRAFELINIYKDDNAYVNRHGAERPSMRETNGDVIYTVRNECQRENVLGLGDCWTGSGLDWGSWNAVYGPRGADGRPKPLWDPKTGVIDHDVAQQWRKYDLRLVLEKNWKTLGPKLQGKLHIWVGDADDYFLNNAVHLLDEFLSKANPPYGGRIVYGGGEGHGWNPLSQAEMMREMAEAMKDRQESSTR